MLLILDCSTRFPVAVHTHAALVRMPALTLMPVARSRCTVVETAVGAAWLSVGHLLFLLQSVQLAEQSCNILLSSAFGSLELRFQSVWASSPTSVPSCLRLSTFFLPSLT